MMMDKLKEIALQVSNVIPLLGSFQGFSSVLSTLMQGVGIYSNLLYVCYVCDDIILQLDLIFCYISTIIFSLGMLNVLGFLSSYLVAGN